MVAEYLEGVVLSGVVALPEPGPCTPITWDQMRPGAGCQIPGAPDFGILRIWTERWDSLSQNTRPNLWEREHPNFKVNYRHRDTLYPLC